MTDLKTKGLFLFVVLTHWWQQCALPDMDGPHVLAFKKVRVLFSSLLNVYVKISTAPCPTVKSW